LLESSRTATVFVIGAYIPNGGTFMAYHLGRILNEAWNYPVVVVNVGAEVPDAGILPYDPVFPAIPLEELVRRMAPQDILVCNPSFSDHCFGLTLPGRKICYVQDYRTFGFLDRFFDGYVAVGGFVQDFLRQTYDLSTEVIPPFITLPDIAVTPWEMRPRGSIVISAKGAPALLTALRAKLRDLLRERAPEVDAAIDWDDATLQRGGKLAHGAFCQRLAQARFCLSLTPGEGFGLIPLEAMGLGTVVLGFDGFGGRHYFRRGRNCLVRPYPDVAGVADDLVTLLADEDLGQRLSTAGQVTAAGYGYEAFRRAWMKQFTAMLGPPQGRYGRSDARKSGKNGETSGAKGSRASARARKSTFV
jgi:hypothetical protein